MKLDNQAYQWRLTFCGYYPYPILIPSPAYVMILSQFPAFKSIKLDSQIPLITKARGEGSKRSHLLLC